jgi:hypothetical protein
MEAFKHKNHLDIVLGMSGRTLSNGDIVYGDIDSEIEGDSIVVSPDGARLMSEGYNLGQLLDESHKLDYFKKAKYSGIYGVVRKTYLEKLGSIDKVEVAVKGVGFRFIDTTAIDQFNAMRSLSDLGVKCAPPLIATRLRLVTLWVEGHHAYGNNEVDESFKAYITELEKIAGLLRDSGTWRKEWRVDQIPVNYVVGDLSAFNSIDRFIAIDPVAVHSAIEN